MPGVQAHLAVGSPKVRCGAHLRLCLKVNDRMTALTGDTLNSKHALRRELRRQRAGLPAAARHHAQRKALHHLQHYRLWRAARCVALYLAYGSEFDCGEFIRLAWRQHRRVCVPRIVGAGHMRWIALTPQTSLRRNRYGIPEPVGQRYLAGRQQPDLILVPLLGYDAAGYRLGTGGGYYDRLLARRGPRPRRVGVAFSCQYVADLPRDPWDQPLDGILTERGMQWATG